MRHSTLILYCCFATAQGFRRHQKFCQGTKPAVSNVEVPVAKVEAAEAVAEADLEVGAVGDPAAPEVMDSTLRDKMKGGLVCSYVELNFWLQHDVEQS
jgi:hypothetical protein